jgi:hypothetical protein
MAPSPNAWTDWREVAWLTWLAKGEAENALRATSYWTLSGHAPDLVVDRVVGLAQDAVPAPRPRPDKGRRGWRCRAPGVRALLVIDALKGAEGVELLAWAVGRRRGGVVEQGQMGVSEILCAEPGFHQVLTKRSPNMMANWVFASARSRGGIFHS